MRSPSPLSTSLILALCLPWVQAACTPNTSTTDQLQIVLQAGGAGSTLSLCANQVYTLNDTLNFTAPNQEISTEGYPTDDSRATLMAGGSTMTSVINGNQGQAGSLNGIKLRNVQINGNRANASIVSGGSANIAIGGDNTGQLVEYVHSYDPRSWSCLHIAEGTFHCLNSTIQNNDIGPCGSDAFQQWADGISLSCADSLVQNNTITDPTDGGIVIFESPGSRIRNNLIRSVTRTSLGGINMVDVVPWRPFGNYSQVFVEDNMIEGGFATSYGNSTYGPNNASAIIKIGIAIGPNTWWSDGRYGTNESTGATVHNNMLTGAFAFGMAIGGARDFDIENNTFVGNVSFIGNYGPNCTSGSDTPNPPVPILLQPNITNNSTLLIPTWNSSWADGTNLQSSFFQSTNGTVLGLTCFIPPNATEWAWPYAGDLEASTTGTGTPSTTSMASPSSSSASSSASSKSAAGKRVNEAWGEWILSGLVMLLAAGAGGAIL